MILAAGRGERMRPLTDTTPKPLLQVQGKPLLFWLIDALHAAQCPRFVLNTAWLGAQIQASVPQQFAAFADWCFSNEEQDFGYALETAGGIARALPLLFPHSATPNSTDAFWLTAGDVFVPGFVFSAEAVRHFLQSNMLAHLWLVPNPAHHPAGDFWIEFDPSLRNTWQDDVGLARHHTTTPDATRYTYSTIGLYRKELFLAPWCDIAWGNPTGLAAPLAPLLRRAMENGRVSAQIYRGAWTDVGTPERLADLNKEI